MDNKLQTTLALPTFAVAALALLEDAGFESWCVGGFVRDSLMGRPTNDIDIATPALWQQVREVFEAAGYKTFETGIAHGTLTVAKDGELMEVTTFRVDGTYSDRRHPDSVRFVSSIEEDLARRDFTINAIAYHPRRGILDPYGGRSDIASATIRTVGEASQRFTEDPLRILRGVRFASQLGFAIEEATFEAMSRQKELLDTVAVERIRLELDGVLCGEHVLEVLLACIDIIGQVIPELLPMKDFDQLNPHHIYDVLEHTARCVAYVTPVPLNRWAALFHDLGKPRTFFTDDEGVGHFHGHPKHSVAIARSIMNRLKFPTALKHDVLLLVEYHDRELGADPKAIKRMLLKLGGRVDLLYALTDLKRGDASAQAPQSAERVELALKIDEMLTSIVEDHQAFSLKDLAIDGSDVIALGVDAGPQVGVLLERALDGVIEEKCANDRESLLEYLKQAL